VLVALETQVTPNEATLFPQLHSPKPWTPGPEMQQPQKNSCSSQQKGCSGTGKVQMGLLWILSSRPPACPLTTQQPAYL
jgi:hypothetical protein